MKNYAPFILLLSLSAHADEPTLDLQKLKSEIGQSEIDKFIKKPSETGLDGAFLNSLLPESPAKEGEMCLQPIEPKSTHYEVVLIAESGTNKGKVDILPGQKGQFHTMELRVYDDIVPYTPETTGLKSDAVTARAKQMWDMGWYDTPQTSFDPKTPIGQELFIEALVQAAAKSSLKEKELTKSMSDIIASTYKSDEERFKALSAFSLRLYRNYNNARNPGYNNRSNNPQSIPLPEGALTANQLIEAAASFNEFGGGVCNDISEKVAMIGEHLFPDRDVLTVNAGSHFGVIVTDGKTHRIIDGGNQYSATQKLLLIPELSPSNIRISKVKDGALKEIAVVDTEMGQITEAAFQTGKKLLKTDADISSMILHLKNGDWNYAAGAGKLSDSNVVVVVAKYETNSDKVRKYVGVGGTAQKFENGQGVKYQIHLKAGAERSLLHYVNESTDLKISTGVNGSYTYTVNPYNWAPGAYKLDMSVGVDWVNKMEVAYGKQDPNGVQVKGSFQTENTFGPTNWGNTSGALSKIEPSDIKPLLSNVSFHLNQVNADLEIDKKVSGKLGVGARAQYQGSNVGQKVGLLAGLKISAPEGAQILIFTGYTNSSLKGYKTNHSLLAGPTGPEAGIKLTTKKGLQLETKVQRDISGKPSVRGTLTVPLTNKTGR